MFGVSSFAFNSELNKNLAGERWRYCLGGGVCSSQPRSVLLRSKKRPVRELQSPLYKDPHTLCSTSYQALCPGATYTALRGSGLLPQLWHRKLRLGTNQVTYKIIRQNQAGSHIINAKGFCQCGLLDPWRTNRAQQGSQHGTEWTQSVH